MVFLAREQVTEADGQEAIGCGGRKQTETTSGGLAGRGPWLRACAGASVWCMTKLGVAIRPVDVEGRVDGGVLSDE